MRFRIKASRGAPNQILPFKHPSLYLAVFYSSCYPHEAEIICRLTSLSSFPAVIPDPLTYSSPSYGFQVSNCYTVRIFPPCVFLFPAKKIFTRGHFTQGRDLIRTLGSLYPSFPPCPRFLRLHTQQKTFLLSPRTSC